MRILRPAMRTMAGSMGSESFSTPGEMKPSPVEAPAPMNFPTPTASPGVGPERERRKTHGRAFPRTPVSRGTSPARSDASGSRPTTPRIKRIPPPRRSQDIERRIEHEPTPEMVHEWLRHSRSNSSIGSTVALLAHAGDYTRTSSHLGHSRQHSSSSEAHTFVGAPIVPCTDLNKRFESELAKFHAQNQMDSPRPSITISRTNSPPVPTSVLRPAPRPSRDSLQYTGTRDVIGSGFQMPPMPPIPASPAQDHHADPRTPGTGKSFATSVITLDHEDAEIQHVDSRGPVLRPALSAVAKIPCEPVPFPAHDYPIHEHNAETNPAKLTRSRQLSLISAAGLPTSPVEPEEPMPADAKSLAPSNHSEASRMSSDDMHSLRTEIRSRMETPTPIPGGLSTLAWASLVAHAASQSGGLRSPRDSWLSDADRDEDGSRGLEPPPRPRRMSDVPSVLQPGTPTSIGASMFSAFTSPRPAPTPRGDSLV